MMYWTLDKEVLIKKYKMLGDMQWINNHLEGVTFNLKRWQSLSAVYIFMVLISFIKPTFPNALDITSNIKSAVKQQTRTNSTLKQMNVSFRNNSLGSSLRT